VVAGSALSAAAAGNANAGLVEDLLAKSAANKVCLLFTCFSLINVRN
jgi:hypothetical protein